MLEPAPIPALEVVWLVEFGSTPAMTLVTCTEMVQVPGTAPTRGGIVPLVTVIRLPPLGALIVKLHPAPDTTAAGGLTMVIFVNVSVKATLVDAVAFELVTTKLIVEKPPCEMVEGEKLLVIAGGSRILSTAMA